jgi:hypothetical protein
MSAPPSPPHRNKPRKKRPVDVVSFEELLAAHTTKRQPGQLPPEGVVLIGVDVELQKRIAERIGGAPKIPEPSSSRENNDALNVSAPENSSVAPKPPAFSSVGPEPAAPDVGALNLDAPNFNLRALIGRPGKKAYTVHPISRIEDILSPAERDLLRWLWEKGTPMLASERIRVVIGSNGEGARRLATQAGLIYNTFKNLTRALSTKFALDIVKPDKNRPTVYAIYDHAAILERQRQAGFSAVVHKNGGGRELIDSQTHPAPRRPDLTVDELEEIITA